MHPAASPSESGAALIASHGCAFDPNFGIFDCKQDKHREWLVLSFIVTIVLLIVQLVCAWLVISSFL